MVGILRKKKKYYREWLSSCGWGVMLDYDSVMAYSKSDASKNKSGNMYAYDKSFEHIIKVKDEHLQLNDEELSKIYGEHDV